MRWLLNLLRSPSSFRHDPWGYLRNQIGHAYVVGGILGLFLPIWLIALGYAIWEFSQWQWFRAELDDCLDDMAHVMLIAVAASMMLPQLILVHALFLGAGFYWRKGW
jgi:hypothetical protein